MKVKCPFCKQSYELTDDDIVAYGNQNLECAICNKSFTLREAVPALKEYRQIIECQRRLAEVKEQLAAGKQSLKGYKREDQYDYFDEERFSRAGCEMDIEDLKSELEDIKYELSEAKDDYKNVKEKMPKKSEVAQRYACMMCALFEKGFLRAPLSSSDKERLLRYIAMANCDNMLSEIVSDTSLHYCLIEEMQAICNTLATSRHLPMMPHGNTCTSTITPKQFDLLVRFGVSADKIRCISKEDASWMIDFILNKNGESNQEWMRLFEKCANRDELLEKIKYFTKAPVIIPPPKK
ncbi:MAG: hypothetical protein IJS08_15725 [Victivallales bacterium]|nr:hypothetical protein [Victivallales bacterium]